jgi:hypothetical protein
MFDTVIDGVEEFLRGEAPEGSAAPAGTTLSDGTPEPADAHAVLEALADAHADLVATECRLLELAGRWLDVQGPTDSPDEGAIGRVMPGTERFIPAGADGTPEIGEFACAEFAAVQQMGTIAGANRLAGVANLRHRHPRLWALVRAGRVRAWQALEVAKRVGSAEIGLSLEQAQWVDRRTADWVEPLPWGRFLAVLEATIVAADPDGAAAREELEAAEQFVTSGQSNRYGLKTLIAKASAGDVIYFQAMVDRIAQILADQGDQRPVGVRRAAAVGILAQPVRAYQLLAGARVDEADDPDLTDHAVEDEQVAPPGRATDEETGTASGDARSHGPGREPDLLAAPDPSRPGAAPTSPPVPSPASLDPDDLRPPATLYVHLTDLSLSERAGVARVEGYGPVSIAAVTALLKHSFVRVVPVLDVAGQQPVDSYEFTGRMREAVHLAQPAEAFPFSSYLGRTVDIDHVDPFVSPAHGGPPGQTRLDNAAALKRFSHRLKTHGGWRQRQLDHSSWLWRSPHGWYWLVDPTGTHPVPRRVGERAWTVTGQAGPDGSGSTRAP